jgi:hypothetical protein
MRKCSHRQSAVLPSALVALLFPRLRPIQVLNLPEWQRRQFCVVREKIWYARTRLSNYSELINPVTPWRIVIPR